MKHLIFTLSTVFFITACNYKPYLKYFSKKSDTHLPKFKSSDYFRGENNTYRSCYDVSHYNWHISVFPEQKSISGKMKLSFVARAQQDTILIDLHHSLTPDVISASSSKIHWQHKDDLLYIIFENNIIPNRNYFVEIEYHGTPVNLFNEGPIQWKKDFSNNHWISTQTEGIGPHLLFPCKDLLQDQPDSCDIYISYPKNLTSASNGQLISSIQKEAVKTDHWKVQNPINVYNLSFNLADFKIIEKEYTDINNYKHNIQAYVLKENFKRAQTYYDQLPELMFQLEQLYGVFPWWNDGCKFIESTFSAMEHQSAIAMGSLYRTPFQDYDDLLIHELSHEWWGNHVTAEDYCDAWIHEGFATYSEALVLEKIYGREMLNKILSLFKARIYNKRPVVKECGVRYNSWLSLQDQDIYSKGALFLHSLRIKIGNDERFFKALKAIQNQYAKSTVTTAGVQSVFESVSEMDLSVYFDVYLRQLQIPQLELYSEYQTNGKVVLNYKINQVPKDFSIPITIEELDRTHILHPTSTFQSIPIESIENIQINYDRNPYFKIKVIKKAD